MEEFLAQGRHGRGEGSGGEEETGVVVGKEEGLSPPSSSLSSSVGVGLGNSGVVCSSSTPSGFPTAVTYTSLGEEGAWVRVVAGSGMEVAGDGEEDRQGVGRWDVKVADGPGYSIEDLTKSVIS